MSVLRVAIIGSGQVAKSAHIENYLKLNCLIVAVCDIKLENAQNLANEYGIAKVYSDYKTMIDEEKLDAVSICVPNFLHAEITLFALEANLHVLCEKPPALSTRDALKMEQTAKKMGKVLSYNLHYRFSNEVSSLKSMISDGDLGSLYFAKVKALRRRGIPSWGNFTNKAMQGGGPLIDIGIHMLDLALYLMDYPEVSYVSGVTFQKIGTKAGVGLMGAWDPAKFSVEDSAFAMIYFKNGMGLQLETAFALNMKEQKEMNIWLYGDKAGSSLFPLEIYSEEHNQLVNKSYPFISDNTLYYKSLSNFVNACLGLENPLILARQGTLLQEIIEKIYESAENQNSVSFKKIEE